MIIAIAIYTIKQQNKPQKIKYAQQEKGILFSTNQLETLEKSTLPKILSDAGGNNIYHFNADGEHHYVKKLLIENMVIAIVSKKQLQPIELNYLFINIDHVRLRQERVKVSLDDIVMNPFGYIGKDLLVASISQNIAETKQELFNMRDQIIERGEKIEALEKKTIELCEASKQFQVNAKKLNKCC